MPRQGRQELSAVEGNSVFARVESSGRSSSAPSLDPLRTLSLARARVRLVSGRFVARPNRFTAVVRLRSGDETVAHLPEPGRLAGTLTPGTAVLLDGPHPSGRACRFTLVAANEAGTLVCTVPALANRIFAALRPARFFPELPEGKLAAEVRHGRSRMDFRVGDAFVEVKSVTLARGGAGLFPDAVTARGARHCAELAAIARSGRGAALVFIAQRGDIERVVPAADIDPGFAAALGDAARAGVLLLACAVEITAAGPRAARRIPVGGI